MGAAAAEEALEAAHEAGTGVAGKCNRIAGDYITLI